MSDQTIMPRRLPIIEDDNCRMILEVKWNTPTLYAECAGDARAELSPQSLGKIIAWCQRALDEINAGRLKIAEDGE